MTHQHDCTCSFPLSCLCVCACTRGRPREGGGRTVEPSLCLNEDFLSFSLWGVFPEKGLPSPGGRTSCYRELPGTQTHTRTHVCSRPLTRTRTRARAHVWRMHLFLILNCSGGKFHFQINAKQKSRARAHSCWPKAVMFTLQKYTFTVISPPLTGYSGGGSVGPSGSLFGTSESFLKRRLPPAPLRKHMAIRLRSPDEPRRLGDVFKGAAAHFVHRSCYTNLFLRARVLGKSHIQGFGFYARFYGLLRTRDSTLRGVKTCFST